jgi:hypothetical protein
LLAFLGTSQEEGDEPRMKKGGRTTCKESKAKAKCNFIRTKGDDMHECNMMI